MKEIIPPTNCPSCSSILEEVNFQLFCRNTNCNAKGYKTVENFCKIMKYKGLGPETIHKAGLGNIEDILNLVDDNSPLSIAVGEKIAQKVTEIIVASQSTATVPQIIQALGIPLIGKVAAEKIAKAVKSIANLESPDLFNDVSSWGLTEKVLENFQEWCFNNTNLSSRLAKFFKTGNSYEESDKKEYVGVVCITGKLSSFKTKAEGYDYATTLGFKTVENFNKSVTHLINESGKETTTTLKAAQNSTVILTNIFDLEEVI